MERFIIDTIWTQKDVLVKLEQLYNTKITLINIYQCLVVCSLHFKAVKERKKVKICLLLFSFLNNYFIFGKQSAVSQIQKELVVIYQ